MATIWYISKYAITPKMGRVGARGFLLLREFARLGHKGHVITSNSNHLANPLELDCAIKVENVDHVDIHWLRTKTYINPRSLARILSWFDFEWQLFRMPKSNLARPDVVIISSLSLLTILNGLLLRRKYGCKLVFEVRDIWPMVLIVAGGYSWKHPAVIFLGFIERLGYRRADLIVGTMPNLKEHVIEVSRSKKPVICVPQGIDQALLEQPLALPDGYKGSFIPTDKFIVCHAGSIGLDNALDTFFECASRMRDQYHIHFLLIGDGPLKTAYANKYGNLQNVTFAPGLNKLAVQSALVNVDLLYFAVHNSPMMRFGQSLNKVIDYMLSGKPIVASFTGHMSMINEAKCGSIVPAEDVDALDVEIKRYAAMSKNERALIGARGRDWLLENRSFEKLARDFMGHLNKLIEVK